MAPVVTTSSTTTTLQPDKPGLAANSGPPRRSVRLLSLCAVDNRGLARSRRVGTPSCRPTVYAISCAGSNPRCLRRRGPVGVHVTTSRSRCTSASTSRLAKSPPRWRATRRRLRFRSESTTSRARPVNGTAAMTPCACPCGDGPTKANRQVLQIARPGASHPAQRFSKSMMPS